MKIVVIALFCMLIGIDVVYSQDANDFSIRAQKGLLSFEECMSTNCEEAIPSLIYLKQSYENADTYNGNMYRFIVMYLHHYYMSIGDIASSKQLLNDAANIFNQREPEPNNEYFRDILSARGQIEFMLKNYGEALDYFHLAQKCYEEKNDCSEPYMIMMFNMAMSYQAIGDLLSA